MRAIKILLAASALLCAQAASADGVEPSTEIAAASGSGLILSQSKPTDFFGRRLPLRLTNLGSARLDGFKAFPIPSGWTIVPGDCSAGLDPGASCVVWAKASKSAWADSFRARFGFSGPSAQFVEATVRPRWR